MPQTPHFVTALQKKFSELVELKPRPLVFRGKFQFGDHFAECCRSFSISVPTWPMLSPNAKFSLQIGNWGPNLECGDPKMKLGTRILVWEEQRPIGRTKTKSGRRNCRYPRNSRIRNNFRQWRAQFHNRGLQKPNAVEEH